MSEKCAECESIGGQCQACAMMYRGIPESYRPPTRTITLTVDETDYDRIMSAVARYQASHRVDGELMVPDTDGGDLLGAIVSEMISHYEEYADRWATDNEGEDWRR